jgi:hypothetical protein
VDCIDPLGRLWPGLGAWRHVALLESVACPNYYEGRRRAE